MTMHTDDEWVKLREQQRETQQTAPSHSSVVVEKDRPESADPALDALSWTPTVEEADAYLRGKGIIKKCEACGQDATLTNDFVTHLMRRHSIVAQERTAYRKALEIISQKKYDAWAFSECRSIAKNILADTQLTESSEASRSPEPSQDRPASLFESSSETVEQDALHADMEREAMRLTIVELEQERDALRESLAELVANERQLAARIVLDNSASRMKVALIERVREKAAEYERKARTRATAGLFGSMADLLRSLAIELESIDVGIKDKTNEQSK